MRKEYYDYLKFIDDALEIAKKLPRYFSKFSNKIYCNHQKFAIFILMQKFKTTTRGIVSILRASSDLRMHLGLSKVPVHTTIVRFVSKIRSQINNLLDIRQADCVAVDATGFELENKSYYYRTVWNRRIKTKKFMKLNAVIDVKTHRILSYKIYKSCRHESKDFSALLEELDVKYVLADKGYSSKANRNFVVRKLNAIPIIPKKKSEGKYYIKLGKILPFDEERYHQRSIIENVFFCIKKNYGSVLRCKSSATQKAELISKLIAHNVDRMQHIYLLISRGLHQRYRSKNNKNSIVFLPIMGLFDNILKDNETLFKNELSLDPSFQPKLVPFRENENMHIATCIKPLFEKRSGKNLLIYGSPGIGKTLACKKVLEELEEKTDDIIPIYVNCWKKDSSYKAVVEICSIIGYKMIQNKKTDELMEIVAQKLNKKSVVFVLDEVDKLTDFSFLYSILEDIYRKTIIMITNDKEFLHKLEPRLKSRLIPELLEFKPYKLSEIQDILKQRIEYAFYPNIFDKNSFEKIVEKTFELKDIRIGLFLLKESANIAEGKASKKILNEHVNNALTKIQDYQKPMQLDEDESKILELIKLNPEKTTPELFELYQKQGGYKTDRTFHRKLKNLEKAKLISMDEVENMQGKSFKVKTLEVDKKITDF